MVWWPQCIVALQRLHLPEYSGGGTKGRGRKNVSPYYVTNLMQDSAGTLWVTSHTGLYYFDKEREILLRPTTADGHTDEFFLSALQDIKELPSGELMAGGDGAGLVIFDKKLLK